MKARVISKISIAADPAAIYEYLIEPRYHHLWNAHLKKITPLTRLESGATYKTSILLFGAVVHNQNHAISCRLNEYLELESKTGTIQYNVRYRLQPLAKVETRLICSTVVSANGRAFAFAKPLLSELARRELHSDLVALKQAVEQHTEPEISSAA